MKSFVLLFSSLVLNLNAHSGNSQHASISIDTNKNISLKKVFNLIKKETDYQFVYDVDMIKDAPNISLKKGSITVKTLLDLGLSPIDCVYEFLDNTIIVKKQVQGQVTNEIQQQFSASGLVTDDTGQPLPGANILEKGTTNGTQADFDGRFSLVMSSQDAVLVISFIGYSTLEIPVNNQSQFTLTLQEDASSLDGVIVTGYTDQSKRTITGSVENIAFEELNKNPGTSADQQLQGKISGVNIVTNGAPGGSVQVRIRGFATLGNKDPLYIIDGAPGGGLNDINPNDIETVSVLKDGTAASIYGSRGANGVIVIATKKGRRGQTPKISYDTFLALDFDGGNKPNMISPKQWGELEFAGQRASGNQTPSHPSYGSGATPVIPEFLNGDPTLPYDPVKNRLLRSANTDWYDLLNQTGLSQQHNISVRGGGESGIYALSFGYLNREGFVIETGFKRYTTRVNTTFSFLDEKIKVGENLTVAYLESKGSIVNPSQRITYFPLIPRFDEGGNFGGTLNGILGLGTNFQNPEAIQVRAKDALAQRWRIFGNAFVELEIFRDLTLKSNIAVDFTQTANRRFNPEFPEGGNPGNNYTQSSGYDNSLTLTNTISYAKTIDNHNLTVFGGIEAIEITGRGINFDGTNYFSTDPNFLNISNAGKINSVTGAGGLTRRLASVFGKLDYSFKNKYILNFVGTIETCVGKRSKLWM